MGGDQRIRIADSYLDHIRIAVEAGDTGAPFRDFIDNWAALAPEESHHRRASNRVIWFNNPDAVERRDMLLSLPFRSNAADAILRYAADQPQDYRARRDAKDEGVRLIVDHAVPLKVMVDRLFQDGVDLSRDAVRGHLVRHYHLGLLTYAENASLSRLGLGRSMPANWDGVDVVARYRAANIVATFV